MTFNEIVDDKGRLKREYARIYKRRLEESVVAYKRKREAMGESASDIDRAHWTPTEAFGLRVCLNKYEKDVYHIEIVFRSEYDEELTPKGLTAFERSYCQIVTGESLYKIEDSDDIYSIYSRMVSDPSLKVSLPSIVFDNWATEMEQTVDFVTMSDGVMSPSAFEALVTKAIVTGNCVPLAYREDFKTYLMRDREYVKIGRSTAPAFRESTLQAENPTIHLFAVCEKDVESALHRKYQSKRVRGEWFLLNEDDIRDIVSDYNFKIV